MKVLGQSPFLQDVKGGAKTPEMSDQLRKHEGTIKNPSVKTSSFIMDKMKARMDLEPDVRADRVAELKAQIKNGEYKVDTDRLAGNILLGGLKESAA